MHNHRESGAITIAETLIALAIGIIALTVWAQGRLSELETNSAKAAGRTIAAYSRAASIWLAENPPNANGDYDITSLQDCSNEKGARYLSCSFGPQTQVKFAYDGEGNRINFGNLTIKVSLNDKGATGNIDFGIFRSGSDRNDDGLPDSRPDLAAIALETASESTGAGVLDFFELSFARDNPDGLVYDEKDASFDQSKIDDLARLDATVGANVNDAPFLRLDGSNEMTSAVSFENGMQVTMNGEGLSFEGPGDVEVQTSTGKLFVLSELETPKVQSDSATFDSLRVDPKDGVKGDGFDKFDQSADINRIDTDLLNLISRVATNESSITDNASDITQLSDDVNENTTNIDSNTDEIENNSDTIDANTLRIKTLEGKNDPSTYPLCTPSKQDKVKEMSSRGYSIYYDLNTHSGNCNFGVSCSGKDRCGDTVRGTIQTSNSWGSNPVSYSGRNSTDLKCATYRMNFYGGCGCVLPKPSGCK